MSEVPAPSAPRSSRMTRNGLIAAVVAVLAVALIAGLASISPWMLVAAVAGGAPGWLIASALLNGASHVVGGFVWHRCLRVAGLGAIPLAAAMRAHWVCRGASELTPLQIGEAARVVALRKEPAASGATWRVIGSIGAMKMLDTAVTLPMVALVIILLIDPNATFMAIVAGVMLVVIVATLLLRRGRSLITLLPERGHRIGQELIEGAAALRTMGTLVRLWSVQAASTALRIAGLAALLLAYGAPLAAAPTLFAFLVLAGLIPLAPGGAGTREAAVVPMLVGVYGLGLDAALAASLAVQAVALTVALIGAGIAMVSRARVALPLDPAPSPA